MYIRNKDNTDNTDNTKSSFKELPEPSEAACDFATGALFWAFKQAQEATVDQQTLITDVFDNTAYHFFAAMTEAFFISKLEDDTAKLEKQAEGLSEKLLQLKKELNIE